MSYAAYMPSGIDLGAIAKAISPAPVRFDPFGFVTGYKAYQIYTALAAKSDSELNALGIKRTALPAIAMAAARETRRG